MDNGMKIGILGSGLSGISSAYFLRDEETIDSIELLDKEPEIGGLCRSFALDGVYYDIGPHILFSKNTEILQLMVGLLGENVRKHRRSNKILYKGALVKYPFENDLFSLSEEQRIYCLNTFLHNPYESYVPQNLLQYFLSTFGEGITNLYLRPYNEKIWKFDPSFIDIEMIGRIPKPPKEDIIKSAAGIPTEGYLHQLFFYYPREGGIVSLVKAMRDGLHGRTRIFTDSEAVNIRKEGNCWRVALRDGSERRYDTIISTIPPQELVRILGNLVEDSVRDAVSQLKYNSIVISALRFRKDRLGDNFAVNIPDSDIIFHRLSKLNFLGMDHTGLNTLLAEVTFRKGDGIDALSDAGITAKIIDDLVKLNLVDRDDFILSDLKRFEYAYVIYDVNHRKNMSLIKDYLEKRLGIILCGRFGTFEYLNMDAVILQAMEIPHRLKEAR
jgi:protoporphyrinogen oxidase